MLFQRAAVLAAVVAAPMPGAVAQNQPASVEASLVEVRARVQEADAERARLDEGLLLSQVQVRLSVLRSTEAMLEQKRLASLLGIAVVWRDEVPACGILPDDRLRIGREAERVRAEIAEAEQEAARYSGGLLQAMALVRAATAKVQLAVLDQGRVLADAGIPLRLPPAQDAPAAVPGPPGKAVPDAEALR